MKENERLVNHPQSPTGNCGPPGHQDLYMKHGKEVIRYSLPESLGDKKKKKELDTSKVSDWNAQRVSKWPTPVEEF